MQAVCCQLLFLGFKSSLKTLKFKYRINYNLHANHLNFRPKIISEGLTVLFQWSRNTIFQSLILRSWESAEKPGIVLPYSWSVLLTDERENILQIHSNQKRG